MENKVKETYGEAIIKSNQFILASSPLDEKMKIYKDKTILVMGRFY
jgi:hypothetical protein